MGVSGTWDVTGVVFLTVGHMAKVKAFSGGNEDSYFVDLSFIKKEIFLGGPELIRGAL